MAKTEKVYVVYRYDFPDGSAYVGRTARTLAKRDYAHRHEPNNRYLYHQLQKHPDTKPQIISLHSGLTGHSRADRAEKLAIAALDKPLNSVWIAAPRHRPEGCRYGGNDDPLVWRMQGRTAKGKVRKKRSNYQRNEEIQSQKCRICRKVRPAAEFWSDRYRTCGIASRCKLCDYHVKKIHGLAIRAGINTSVAYRECVNAIRDGTIADRLSVYTLLDLLAGDDVPRLPSRLSRPRQLDASP